MQRRTTFRIALLLVSTAIGWAAGGGAYAQSGDLKLTTRADGVPVITNETPAQHARRVADHRLPVPDSRLEDLIDRYSALRRLDPELVQAVIQAESGYNVRALSDKGAMGLMQLLPATAASLDVTDPWDPEQNVRGGTAYLARLLERYGRLELALAAYNAGPTTVDEHEGIPPYPETRTYIRRVIRLYRGEDAPVDLSLRVPQGRKPLFVHRPGQRPLLTTEPPPR